MQGFPKSTWVKRHPHFYPILIHFLVYIPWDIEEYYSKHVKSGQDRKRVSFPNPQFGAHSDPLTVVDSKGRIVLWYLPGLLSIHQQVVVSFATPKND